MLLPEVVDEIALVATASDSAARFSLALVRVKTEYRRERGNRDKKSSLNAAGRAAVRWLWSRQDLCQKTSCCSYRVMWSITS